MVTRSVQPAFYGSKRVFREGHDRIRNGWSATLGVIEFMSLGGPDMVDAFPVFLKPILPDWNFTFGTGY